MRTYFGVDRSDYELVKGYVFTGYVDCPIAPRTESGATDVVMCLSQKTGKLYAIVQINRLLKIAFVHSSYFTWGADTKHVANEDSGASAAIPSASANRNGHIESWEDSTGPGARKLHKLRETYVSHFPQPGLPRKPQINSGLQLRKPIHNLDCRVVNYAMCV